MNRSKEMQEGLDHITESLFGISHADAMNANICTGCNYPITDFRDELSMQEYMISSFCQLCQDEVFGE